MAQTNSLFRNLPSVSEILGKISTDLPNDLLVLWIREILQRSRRNIQKKNKALSKSVLLEQIYAEVQNRIQFFNWQFATVINGTGVILHTGLGRAPLGQEMLDSQVSVMKNYVSLEIDFSGKRGDRFASLRDLLKSLTGADDALVVNNNAAAVLLVLNSLADGKEVVVSRGEQVEIGGSFRIPDVVRKSGATMIEVGTTNRTHLEDYQKTITKNTAVLLQAHTSNFRVQGFTKSVDLGELASLGKKHRIPVVSDLGSGALVDLQLFGFCDEPLVKDVIKLGVSVATFSGDKLIGGPQCGIIVGKKSLIGKMKKNSLLRAIRPDKSTLLILKKTLLKIAQGKIQNLPLFQLLSRTTDELHNQAESVIRALSPEILEQFSISIDATTGQFGSGSMPTEEFESVALIIKSSQESARSIFERLVHGTPSVLSRIHNQKILIDLRTVFPSELNSLIEAINNLAR
ncbi:L-seryl-tRNA(Sec) selenium transferase [bacterium]|nr:L-seryl-tRNA(Sec) selenium transferase [bacterium]